MRKDKFTVKQRGRIMQRIRSSKTKFEEDIFRKVRKSGVYFRTHSRSVFGKPDIVLVRAQKAVFLHSDFWHGWRLPAWEHVLPSKFWKQKLKKNRLRDKKVIRTLRRQGWQVLVIWEHSIKKDQDKAIKSIVEFLKK